MARAPVGDAPRAGLAGGWALRRAWLILAILFAVPLASAQAASKLSGGCRVPEVYLTFDDTLARTEKLVDRSAPVRILVLGPDMGGPALSPKKRSRLEIELARRLPDVTFSILEIGDTPGLVRDDFERIRAGARQTRPDLVIWQLGTADALASTDLDEFSRVLGQAADWLDDRKIDLILVDPPFLPNVSHERAYGRIVRQIDAVSDRERVNVLKQYAATSYLFTTPPPVSDGDPKATLQGGRLCLPELLAEAIVRAATR